jgi:hypothetical protein
MMEAKEPLAKEKEITPAIIMAEQNTLSKLLVPEMSPKPTVVMVDTVQYNATAYNSKFS